MHRSALVAVLPVVAILAFLQGCSKQTEQTECPDVAPVVQEVASASPAGEESYDCTNLDRAGSQQQAWCEAHAQFEKSIHADKPDTFNGYLRGYRHGINHARQGKSSRLSSVTVEGKRESPEDTGYRGGYSSVLKSLGIIEYDCHSSGNASEYKDRWCEASDAFMSAGLSADNPFVKGQFIDGYMAGGRVALTVPTSMESFFSGENPEGKQPAIAQPEGDLKDTELGFYKGFDEGYKAMIASIRESINQVMQQMQIPNNMELPEGMMPPQPGQ